MCLDLPALAMSRPNADISTLPPPWGTNQNVSEYDRPKDLSAKVPEGKSKTMRYARENLWQIPAEDLGCRRSFELALDVNKPHATRRVDCSLEHRVRMLSSTDSEELNEWEPP